MAEHPVTTKIKTAIALLERNGMEVTPGSVKVNAEKNITWADWTPEKAATEALDGRIRRVLRQEGYVIADGERGVRKDFWNASVADLKEQREIKLTSSQYDRVQIKAGDAVIAFLEEKEKEFGYEVYPGLFQSDIDRIYSMHGLSAPGLKEAA